MTRPLFAVLAAAYPRKQGVDQAMLYTGIGHPEYANDPAMENTCAARVSMALLAVGIHPPGNLTVNAGRFAGLRIETNQHALSRFLRKRLGAPEVYKNGYAAWAHIRSRHGIVSFFHLQGGDWDPQGHIDLVEPTSINDLQCAGACHWSSTEIWFWPLP